MTVQRYVALVAAGAVLCTLVIAIWIPQPTSAQVWACALMVAIGFVSHSWKYQAASGASGSVSLIPFLATVVLCPNWLAPVAVAVAVGCGEVRAKRIIAKKVFNASQFGLAVAVACMIFVGLGGESPLLERQLRLGMVLALAGASFGFLAVNKVSVAAAISISEKREEWITWRRLIDASILYDFISLPFAYGFARVYTDLGVLWTVVLPLPLLGVRQLYRTNWQLQRTSEELLQLIVNAIEARDPYTSGHSKRVAHYATIIARSLGMRKKEVDRVFTAAILHDVGKIHEDFAPILRKPSSLTIDERATIESHSERGAQLVATVTQLEDIVPVVLHHHERWDGRGYPAGLAGQEIPVGSRIIMLADTIDAMTSDRPYRPALSRDVVLAELDRMAGIQFDPIMTRAFMAGPATIELFDAVDSYHASNEPERDVTRLFDRARRVRIA